MLAEAIGVKTNVADMALDHLIDGGWITSHPDGGYLAVEPPPKRVGTFYEAVWGDQPPHARAAPEPPAVPVVAELPAPRIEVPIRAPRPKPRDRRLETHSTYLVGIDGFPLVKIGRTTWNPKARLKSLQTGQPMDLYLLWSVPGDYERDLHVRFAKYRVRGEWFDLSSLGDPVEVVETAVEELKGPDEQQ